MASERNKLAGAPPNRKIKLVRSHLRRYGIRPREDLWLLTWKWAYQVASSYLMHMIWPDTYEIAAQYVLLMLAEMQSENRIKLPPRAAEQMPASIAAKLNL